MIAPFVPLPPLIGLALAAPSAAQGPDHYTFHVYVDPIYGDNDMASVLNPRTAHTDATKRPLADYPNSGFPDPAGPNGSAVLQHAPYSFRTVTRVNGALDYITSQIAPTGLPVEIEDGKFINWIVIHCLPGLYGPDSTLSVNLDDYDSASQMRFNGEEFPVRLPKGVSLQGTSALDTIFDGRGLDVPIIRTGEISPEPDHPQDYFIDSLTIRNSVSDEGEPVDPSGNRNFTGAGIYISGDEGDVPLTISNCFITDNAVGIAIERPSTSPVSPRIVNNTLAFNFIGVWNGYRDPFLTLPNVGWGTPVVVNNIFDTRRHDDADELQRSPFLGVHPDDLTVATVTPPGGTPVAIQTAFNAWDAGRENQVGNQPVSNYPPPALRTPGSFPSPRVDLGPYLGAATVARGILYVNDAFRASPAGNISPHDFRLAPHSALAGADINETDPISAKSPVVNQGLDLGDASVRYDAFSMGSSNGNTITRAPGIGLPAPSPDPDVFHAWDWDAEGFGNPRIRCRVGFSAGDRGQIDLGADEMDELIMAGYVPSTRMFAVLANRSGTIVGTQTSCYFFDLRGTTHPRPVFSGQLGQDFNWWIHAWYRSFATGCRDCQDITVTSTSTTIETNYTSARRANGATTTRSQFIPTSVSSIYPPPDGLGKPVIMRNLECDFSPHLLTDWHHLWGGGWFGPSQFPPPSPGPDIYASNPWFGDTLLSNHLLQPRFALDNWHLYSNPSHPNTSYASDVFEGTLNAPGTYWTGPRVECGALPSYLLPGAATLPFGPYTPCTGTSPTTYAVGIYGFGDSAAGCPDILPLIAQWLGVRYNCQVASDPASNLQTFLAVIGDQPFPKDPPPNGATGAGQGYYYPGAKLPLEQALPPDSPKKALERLLMSRQ